MCCSLNTHRVELENSTQPIRLCVQDLRLVLSISSRSTGEMLTCLSMETANHLPETDCGVADWLQLCVSIRRADGGGGRCDLGGGEDGQQV